MRSLVCIASLVLAGCGSWQRPNTDEAQFQQDSRLCEAGAARTYPPPLWGFSGFPDDNAASRQAYYSSCLKEHGYEWRTLR